MPWPWEGTEQAVGAPDAPVTHGGCDSDGEQVTWSCHQECQDGAQVNMEAPPWVLCHQGTHCHGDATMGVVTPRDVWPWRCRCRSRDAHGDATRGQVAMGWQCQWVWQCDSDRPCVRQGWGGSVPALWVASLVPSRFGWIPVLV